MPEGWAPHALYELADYTNGRATKPSELTEDGIPVIKIAELSRGITDATNRVPASHVQSKHWVRDGDLLFAWSGSVGIHIYRGDEAALNQHIFNVTAHESIDQCFLRYLLLAQMPTFLSFVEGKRTTMGHVTVADLKTTDVLVPPLDEQRRIAAVLGALDDKIESNTRCEGLTGDLLQLGFEHQFGSHWAGANHAGRDADGGHSWGSVRDLVDLVYGKALKAADRAGGSVAVVGSSGVVGWHDRELTEGPCVVVGRKGTAGSVIWVDDSSWPIDTTYYIRCHDGIPVSYAYHALLAATLPEAALDSAVPGLNRDAAYARAALIPERDAAKRFDDFAQPLLAMRRGVRTERVALAAIRDELLPRLVSGRLRVPDTKDPDGIIESAAEGLHAGSAGED